ncbi:hypothetical protein [Sphingomonas hylomeconis]|uniref:DUF2063 domain-containing protein n=1 Tax=Sphingomonas hylomeconis TaxID=1395958 RepID=A0ABV7SUH3_9SPHN|nr:hypothetical protein [Sphingomonas hylomeconis]
MNARQVWHTWRRILADDDLVAHVSDLAAQPAGARAALAPPAQAILDDYAGTPLATATNIGMYRRGLTRNALGTLSLVPLTRHLLFMTDLDIDTVAERFVATSGYRDFGPNFWESSGAFVAFLATLPEFAHPAWQDATALDAATVALARRLGRNAPPNWPGDRAAPSAVTAATQIAANPAAAIVASRHDLSGWIKHPQDFDPGNLPPAEPSFWLVYFATAESTPAYVQLSERAAQLMTLLATPCRASDAAAALGVPIAQVLDIVAALSELGMVGVADEPVRSAMPADAPLLA